ncbi:hypothetical protein CDG77_32400 [Nostoc sp. 'Peltigera membranacea cyanobiont' 213]|uniref:hypothetical protein n=1 Tax=Nostoc sp. 'Peltigera membranacea cyanobiont' 213 TaxID=2014530 RepID=UPI000B95AC7C|nr:hypothetical protein [Nostoc sp. 'Peltigera membranacea cyanobiont' 213]OYD86892.1 hypothetical protein CDG77_32400 [Nostoc sp. 'Peltigera membranacea cyanobiont' 213]
MNQPPSRRRKKAIPAASNDSTLPNDLAEEDISPQENPALATIDVTAVEIPELTEQEQSDRLHLERRVERAFFEAGKALTELRDRRLYRSTHKTFEDYCRERFGFSRRQPYHLIEAAVIFDNLVEKCERSVHILPTNEWQIRPLSKLDPDIQPEAWEQAVESANGKVPSHRIVKDAVQRIMERTQVPNTYQLGEVCQILAKDNPELRGKGGCWGIVSQVNEFSCTVKTWDGEYTVGLQYLKSLNYLPAECEQMRVICDRISQVYSDSLEETVKSLLQSLGKLNRPYLTAVEEKLLTLLESEYGRIP